MAEAAEILEKTKVVKHVYNILVLCVGWTFFRVGDVGRTLQYLKRMFLPWMYTASGYAVQELVTNRAFFVAACGILGCGLLGTESSHAIIGTLMILTPGIAFTMGIRDFVQGDYLSGTIRMIDALLIAASIAIGAGLVLSLYAFLKGVAVV